MRWEEHSQGRIFRISECVENIERVEKGCASQDKSGTRDVGLPGEKSASSEEQDDTGKLASWRSSSQWASREGCSGVSERGQEDGICDRVAHWHSTTSSTSRADVAHRIGLEAPTTDSRMAAMMRNTQGKSRMEITEFGIGIRRIDSVYLLQERV